MIEPMHKVELALIQQKDNETSCSSNGRILEAYRGTYIDTFCLNQKGENAISVFIKNRSEVKQVGGDQQFTAVEAIWKEYFSHLTCWQRTVRILYSHRAWLSALVLSVTSATIVLAVSSIWEWIWVIDDSRILGVNPKK